MDATFWNRLDRSVPSPYPELRENCWEYRGALSSGYGRVKRNGKLLMAHRYAWQEINGPIPSGAFICHKCDNPPCCNPSHLFVGDPSTNMLDAYQKGRLSMPENGARFRAGQIPANAVLHGEAVEALRKDILENTKWGGLVAIAKKHGVPYQTVRDISAGRSYIAPAKAPTEADMRMDPDSTPAPPPMVTSVVTSSE